MIIIDIYKYIEKLKNFELIITFKKTKHTMLLLDDLYILSHKKDSKYKIKERKITKNLYKELIEYEINSD